MDFIQKGNLSQNTGRLFPLLCRLLSRAADAGQMLKSGERNTTRLQPQERAGRSRILALSPLALFLDGSTAIVMKEHSSQLKYH